MGDKRSPYVEDELCLQHFKSENLTGGDYFGHIDMDGRITLKCITGIQLARDRFGRCGFVNTIMNLRVP
jgi:hypothetical protein